MVSIRGLCSIPYQIRRFFQPLDCGFARYHARSRSQRNRIVRFSRGFFAIASNSKRKNGGGSREWMGGDRPYYRSFDRWRLTGRENNSACLRAGTPGTREQQYNEESHRGDRSFSRGIHLAPSSQQSASSKPRIEWDTIAGTTYTGGKCLSVKRRVCTMTDDG